MGTPPHTDLLSILHREFVPTAYRSLLTTMNMVRCPAPRPPLDGRQHTRVLQLFPHQDCNSDSGPHIRICLPHLALEPASDREIASPLAQLCGFSATTSQQC